MGARKSHPRLAFASEGGGKAGGGGGARKGHPRLAFASERSGREVEGRGCPRRATPARICERGGWGGGGRCPGRATPGSHLRARGVARGLEAEGARKGHPRLAFASEGGGGGGGQEGPPPTRICERGGWQGGGGGGGPPPLPVTPAGYPNPCHCLGAQLWCRGCMVVVEVVVVGGRVAVVVVVICAWRRSGRGGGVGCVCVVGVAVVG